MIITPTVHHYSPTLFTYLTFDNPITTNILVATQRKLKICFNTIASTDGHHYRLDDYRTMSFFVELWHSVFEPGTNSALLTATHGSFILLFISLSWMIYTTHSIHFINLLIISLLLYISVIWFVSELKKTKLRTNEEIEKETATESKKDK